MTLFTTILLTATVAFISSAIRYLYIKRKKRKEEVRLNAETIHKYGSHLDKYIQQIIYASKHVIPFQDKYCSWTELQNKFAEIKKNIVFIDIPKQYKDNSDLHQQYKSIL